MPTRRQTLVTIAAAGALAPALPGQHQHEQPPATPTRSAPTKPKYFQQADFALLSRLADLIIPRSETPGAVDAGVPLLIDARVASSTWHQERFQQGFASLNNAAKEKSGRPFLEMDEERQIALLTAISQEAETATGELFRLMKNWTIELYYSTPEGLVKELGWHGNTYLPEFKGCTHPEHKA